MPFLISFTAIIALKRPELNRDKTILASAALCASAVGVQAQSSADLYYNGEFSLSYADGAGASTGETFLDGTFEIGGGGRLGGANGLGFNLGVDVFALESETYTAYYPSVVWNNDWGAISVGIPRSVINQGYLPALTFGSANLIGFEYGVIAGSIVHYVNVIADDYTPYGVRYDGEFGGVQIGASYHYVDGGGAGDINVFGLAARYEMAAISSFLDFALSGGVEHYSGAGGPGDSTTYRLGVEGSTDRIGLALHYTGGDTFIGDGLVNLTADYAVTDKITLDAAYITILNGGGSNDTYAVGAAYQFTDMFGADLSYANQTSGGSNGIWEFSLTASF